MTTEQKAIAYDEAIEKIKYVLEHGVSPTLSKEDLQDLFPELKESEDERIRKALVEVVSDYPELDLVDKYGVDLDKILKWLAKQGEQKEYTFKSLPRLLDMIEPTSRAKAYCQKLIDALIKEGYATDAKIVGECLKQMNGEKVAMATMDEQKPVDKVESKFKVGDWIVSSVLGIAHIIGVNDANEYQLEYIDGKQKFSSIDYVNYEYDEWTIQDAKGGDILFQDLMDGKTFIYNGVNSDNAILYSFIISNDGKDVLPYHIGKPNTGIGNIEENKNIIRPATKEQRETLFQKMQDAGYEWDAEKKELRKIEEKPKWTEEDDTYKLFAISAIEDYYDGDNPLRKDLVDWLKDIKQRLTNEKEKD